MVVPLSAFAVGGVVAVLLGVFGRVHDPTLSATTTLGFDTVLDMKVVLAPFPGATVYGQGSESANALAAGAIAGAFFDATGKPARRVPLRPEYVKEMLKA